MFWKKLIKEWEIVFGQIENLIPYTQFNLIYYFPHFFPDK